MKTALIRIRTGRYRHERLGVDVEKTAMPDTPWQLYGPDPNGSGVVHARTLSDARAFLREVEASPHRGARRSSRIASWRAVRRPGRAASDSPVPVSRALPKRAGVRVAFGHDRRGRGDAGVRIGRRSAREAGSGVRGVPAP